MFDLMLEKHLLVTLHEFPQTLAKILTSNNKEGVFLKNQYVYQSDPDDRVGFVYEALNRSRKNFSGLTLRPPDSQNSFDCFQFDADISERTFIDSSFVSAELRVTCYSKQKPLVFKGCDFTDTDIKIKFLPGERTSGALSLNGPPQFEYCELSSGQITTLYKSHSRSFNGVDAREELFSEISRK